MFKLLVLLFVIKLRHSIVVPAFFHWTGNTVDETMEQQHLNQYINIYLRTECYKTSFIHCFIVTTKNLISLLVFLFLCSW